MVPLMVKAFCSCRKVLLMSSGAPACVEQSCQHGSQCAGAHEVCTAARSWHLALTTPWNHVMGLTFRRDYTTASQIYCTDTA